MYTITEPTLIYIVSVVDENIFYPKMFIIDDKERAISVANNILTELKEENNFVNRNFEKEVAISTVHNSVYENYTEHCCRHNVEQGFLFA